MTSSRVRPRLRPTSANHPCAGWAVGAGWPYSAWFGRRYTREDVEALINGLLAVVRTTVKKDLQFTSSSSILLLKQVLYPSPSPSPSP